MDFNFLTKKTITQLPIEPETIETNTPIRIHTPVHTIVQRPYTGKMFTKNNQDLYVHDSLHGQSAFLILGGPSLKTVLDQKIIIHNKEYTGKEILQHPGFVTMSVNNTPRSIRTNLWTSVDSPSHFIKSIWLDPKIQKIIPIGKKEKFVFDNESWNYTDIKIKDCPNVAFYKLNNQFDPDTFLLSDTFNWGNDGKSECKLGIKGKRSVMLPAIRILFELGIKNVYLLGCDFKMIEDQPYHFEQSKHAGAVKSNNNTYDALNKRFSALQQSFLEYDFHVYNCNSDSGLQAFPFISFEEAINDSVRLMPDIPNERTDGLYTRSDADDADEIYKYTKNKKIKVVENVKEDKNGILYLNSGTKCLARLLTSVHSLRKVYDGNICILSMGEESHVICSDIAKHYDCQFKIINQDLFMKKQYWYEKSRMHQYTPFENTLFLDSDTIIQKDISALFEIIEKEHFIVPQFSNWTTQKGVIQKRLKVWDVIDKQLVDDCISLNLPSVNVGVFGFRKDSEFMKHWFEITSKIENAVLPEESTCHLLLLLYKSKVINSLYNYSCKYDSKNVVDAFIIHYHGNKHCRRDNGKLLFNADKWISNWQETRSNNTCDILNWYDKIGDGKLKGYMDAK